MGHITRAELYVHSPHHSSHVPISKEYILLIHFVVQEMPYQLFVQAGHEIGPKALQF